ncbi:peptidoglycan D,D-transpeptidase FtsI family protein [Alkanindiges illinoisensis]|uniref:peptidoglycan D,D-transpeptidase FtsI family protein n=1 Tax=Alkanindiges illinoisensis TaxID=197183 RepID=UPI000555D45D|nr:penicillin-binding protein 2 [Alkanindiges illinoisensis]
MKKNILAGDQKKRTKQRSVTQKPSLAVDLWRFKILWGCVAAFFMILIARAFYVQVLDHQFLQQKADAMILRTDTLKATRGVISDRNGVPLAISTPMVNLWMDPKEYFEAMAEHREIEQKLKENPTSARLKRQLARTNFDLNALADAIGEDREKLIKLVSDKKTSRYIILKRQLPPPTAKVILSRKFQSVYPENDFKRYYPQAQPNAQIIGLTNRNGRGVEGLEMAWNKLLTGEDGKMRVMRDRRGNRIKDVELIKPETPGQNMTLSIDSRLQYILYRELTAAGIAQNARSATAVAVDVKTGEILAMTSWPSFNPNDPNGLTNKDAMRNRAAIDMFEPGSTMKPISMMAALESGKWQVNNTVNTNPGSMMIGNHRISDTHNYGVLDMRGIIVKSSNVGIAKVALSLPYSTMPTFFKRLGYGQRTAVHFPGEAAGLILPSKLWNVSEVATMSYGYSLNATALQVAHAYATLANNGVAHPLTLKKLDKVPAGEQLIDPKITQEVLSMMEGVIQPGGTATRAAIPGYRVAGKTGTARKLVNGRYSTTEYRALFAGIAPVSNPRIAMVVVVENPVTKYGGLAAAPVFSKVMQETLRLLNVPLDRALDLPKLSPAD